ncbi:hypothetical protein GOP97_14635 [Vibrio cholerae]|uniref:hypothetical protein n=1 Tax=Vibrio cholerae TaxID=666 RepID=UPI002DB8127D|nr:hypothetical protein [Vibrio cholerae]MEB5557002.1 hypothetical protein [Vibrio cholerae]
MSWSNCGVDSQGRPIGYVFAGKCDQDGCNVMINRGLSYACGDMHGETEFGCEKYFCEEHRSNWVEPEGDRMVKICNACRDALIESGEWVENEEEGALVPLKEPV